MKRLALVAVVLVLAACTAKKDDAATDTSAPAMAPAPAVIDTAAATRDSIVRDSIAKDSAARATRR